MHATFSVRVTAYKMHARSIPDYACVEWDFHSENWMPQLDAVLRVMVSSDVEFSVSSTEFREFTGPSPSGKIKKKSLRFFQFTFSSQND